MNFRKLGKTNLMVSEVGFGGEWLERHPEEHSIQLIRHAHEKGINIIDCWMPDPKSRDIIGKAIADCREAWYVQGHIGSTWQNGQYVRTRDMKEVVPAFEDLVRRIGGGYIDLGMIHYVDSEEDWDTCMNTSYIDYVHELHGKGIIRHIGLSTHNPRIAKMAAETHDVDLVPVANMGEDSDLLQEQMCGAWTSFARDGKPVLPKGPEWKPFTAENLETMVFDTPCRLGIRFDSDLLQAHSEAVPTLVMQS